MAGRPEKNSARLRHALSTVYASETRSGSREFQASSAARAFCAAVSRVNGGNGGRPCAAAFIRRASEMLGERDAYGPRRIGDDVRLLSAQRDGRERIGPVGRRLEGRAFGVTRDLRALVEGVLHEQLQAPALVVDAGGEVEDAVGRLFAQQFALRGAQVRPGAALVHPGALDVHLVLAQWEFVSAHGV